MLRTGFEPATDNRNRSGPRQDCRRGRAGAIRCGVEPLLPDNRTAPARDDSVFKSVPDLSLAPGASSRPARVRTRTDEVGARHAPAYTTGPRERTTRIEQASPGWKPGALPSELRPRSGTPGWIRTSVLCRRRAVLLSTELRAFRGASGRSRTRTSAVQRARACRSHHGGRLRRLLELATPAARRLLQIGWADVGRIGSLCGTRRLCGNADALPGR